MPKDQIPTSRNQKKFTRHSGNFEYIKKDPTAKLSIDDFFVSGSLTPIFPKTLSFTEFSQLRNEFKKTGEINLRFPDKPLLAYQQAFLENFPAFFDKISSKPNAIVFALRSWNRELLLKLSEDGFIFPNSSSVARNSLIGLKSIPPSEVLGNFEWFLKTFSDAITYSYVLTLAKEFSEITNGDSIHLVKRLPMQMFLTPLKYMEVLSSLQDGRNSISQDFVSCYTPRSFYQDFEALRFYQYIETKNLNYAIKVSKFLENFPVFPEAFTDLQEYLAESSLEILQRLDSSTLRAKLRTTGASYESPKEISDLASTILKVFSSNTNYLDSYLSRNTPGLFVNAYFSSTKFRSSMHRYCPERVITRFVSFMAASNNSLLELPRLSGGFRDLYEYAIKSANSQELLRLLEACISKYRHAYASKKLSLSTKDTLDFLISTADLAPFTTADLPVPMNSTKATRYLQTCLKLSELGVSTRYAETLLSTPTLADLFKAGILQTEKDFEDLLNSEKSSKLNSVRM